jgi:hypothetical protein
LASIEGPTQSETAGIVAVPDQEVQGFVWSVGHAVGDDPIDIGQRRARRGGRRGNLLMQEIVDLFVKDQRQAGDAQQQHECGADQAGPGVNPRPSSQRRVARRHRP